MGREVKRVALTFNWPLHKVWRGYVNPHPGPTDCAECKGDGYNAATRQIGDDFYGFDDRSRRWVDKVTQDEVEALIVEGRLLSLWQRWNDDKGAWVPFRDPPTAAEVNALQGPGHFMEGHDAINRWVLVKARANRLGVFGKCPTCRGRGHMRQPRKAKKRYDYWRPKEPPIGPGWQVWETVSEGSPVSPVFTDRMELVSWLVASGYSQLAAMNFVTGSGWVPSMILTTGPEGNELFRDIESARLMNP